MQILTLDFETYWDREGYTLSKMSTESYIRDKRFKAHCVGLKINDGDIVCASGEAQIRSVFNRIPWDKTILLCQNTSFDAFILKEIYGKTPKMYADTMSMFRALYPDRRASLKSICETLGLPPKGNEVMNTSGKVNLSDYELERLMEYCKDDVRLTWAAWQRMKDKFTVQELKLIDITIRWSVDAVLELDKELLSQSHQEEVNRKNELLSLVSADRETLSSNDKFADYLRSLGLRPPIKLSPTAVKKDKSLVDQADNLRDEEGQLTSEMLDEAEIPWAYAFSKSDKEFMNLLDHPDERVQAAVEARLGVKSTQKETRSKRLIEIAERGRMPVPLYYYGAAPGRWSACNSGKINLQNLPRHRFNETGELIERSKLRDAICAPDGYMLVANDLSNIEARVLAYVAGEEKLVQLFRDNSDVYCAMAADIYQRPITKKDKNERQLGKTIILGSGYGMSWKRFVDYCPVKFTEKDLPNFPDVNVEWFLTIGKNFLFTKNYKPSNVELKDYQAHCAICSFLINCYRESNPHIVQLWRDSGDALMDIYNGREVQVGAVPGLVTTCSEGYRFPNGRYVRYFGLSCSNSGRRLTWSRQTRTGRGGLHGGLCTENIVQALSRHILADQLVLLEQMGYRSVFTCHDEIVFCVPEDKAEDCLRDSTAVMSTAPGWISGVPLACEGSIAKRYGDAK